MFACLHAPRGNLTALALSFSPVVEQTSADTVVFSLDGLERFIGPPHQIASEIGRYGAAQGIHGNLAIANDPDTAVIVARNRPGVTVIATGKEADTLASFPIEALDADPIILDTFESWGVDTLAQLAALPEIGIAARFGEEGIRLQRLALGRANRALRVIDSPMTFAKRVELDHPIGLLEPLLFLLSSILHELTESMRRRSLAANRVELVLELDNKSVHRRVLEFGLPCSDAKMLLKLLQLDLEAHPAAAEVVALRMELHPTPPQVLQHGLFLSSSPEPQKLQIVAARLSGLVGEGNVGSPTLLNTHRPDAFAIRPFRPVSALPQKIPLRGMHLAFRVFRPALKAEVRWKHDQPAEVKSSGVRGVVCTAAGPWHSSGDWWSEERWSREEWDVDLSDGGVYRIYCRLDSRCWFVEGFYD
jgi:protein ImuB